MNECAASRASIACGTNLAGMSLERVSQRPGVKWTWYDDDVLAAWVADMDFVPSSAIAEELYSYIDGGDWGYVNPGVHHTRVVKAFEAWVGERHGWRPDPPSLRVIGDVMQGVAACIQAFTKPGDGVIIQTPVYHPFGWAISSSGRRIVEAPLTDRRTGFRVTAEALESAAEQGARLLLLSNPHNPSGRVFSVEELGVIGEVAVEYDLIVLSDEIHADLVFAPHRHVPLAVMSSGVAERTVTLMSASKTFNLAAVGCAVASFGSETLLKDFEDLPTSLLGHPSGVAVRATAAAWESGGPWLEETMRQLEINRSIVTDWAERHLEFRSPEATYLAWLDFRSLGWSEEPDEVVLREAKVALSPGLQFGTGGAGHARLNFATYPDLLGEILERIGRLIPTG